MARAHSFDGSDKLGAFTAVKDEYTAGNNRINAITKTYKSSNFTVFEVVSLSF